MEHLVKFGLSLLGWLAFNTVFGAIGALIIKVLTLGRYPRAAHLRADARLGFPVMELVAVFGMLCSVGLLVLGSKLLA